MSYSCYLTDPVTGEVLLADHRHQIIGGIYEMGGTRELYLNVTYNYGSIIRSVLDDGIPGLEGKSGAETIPLLKKAASQLSDDVDPDYWQATEGNAKRALCGLLALAEMRPDGIWRIS